MADPRIERQYAKLLANRQKTVDLNVAQGRSMNMPGVSLNEAPETASTLSDVINKIKQKGGVAQNLENTIKTTPTDTIGIAPEISYKTRFPSVNKALGTAEDIGRTVNEDTGGLLKNQGGFSKVLPALGLGAAALGALGIANKVQAGEYGQAGLDTADLATDYVPILSQIKMAGRPSELGSGELPEDVMKERQIYNQNRVSGQTGTPSSEQPLIEPEDRAKYDDMKSQFQNILNKVKK